MTEAWRRKTYYRPRVLVDAVKVLDPQFPDALLCITGAQLEMLRNLTQYLHRRSTFVSELDSGYYLVPDNDDWDDIQTIVADLEETLMGCEELTAVFESMLAQLQCVCSKMTTLLSYGPALDPLVQYYLDEGTMVDTDENDDTVPVDADRCALAQLTFWQAWNILTEWAQPAQELGMDVVVPLVIALFVTTTGGPVLGIPAATLILAISALVESLVDGSLANVQNEYWAFKDEIICALYRGLDTSYQQAENNTDAVIADMDALSPIDKTLLHIMTEPWMIYLAQVALTANTPWAQANVESGACDDCDELVGDDWWALYRDKDTNTLELDHTVGGYWLDACWQYSIPAGQTVCGVVFEVKNLSGDCDIKRMSAFEAGCSGTGLWDNQSGGDCAEAGWYFAVNGDNIDEVGCKAQLAPGSTTLAGVTILEGALDINGGWNMGFSCTGYAEIHVAWVVFEGTSPP